MSLKNNHWQPFLFKITMKYDIVLSEIMVIPDVIHINHGGNILYPMKKIHRVVFEDTRNKLLGPPAL